MFEISICWPLSANSGGIIKLQVPCLNFSGGSAKLNVFYVIRMLTIVFVQSLVHVGSVVEQYLTKVFFILFTLLSIILAIHISVYEHGINIHITRNRKRFIPYISVVHFDDIKHTRRNILKRLIEVIQMNQFQLCQ